MSEEEWLASNDPERMLLFLERSNNYVFSRRKMRLFACECCRRIWHLIPAFPGQEAVEVAERYAEGLASEAERDEAASSVFKHFAQVPSHIWGNYAALLASERVLRRFSQKTQYARSYGPDHGTLESTRAAVAIAAGKQPIIYDPPAEEARKQGYEPCNAESAGCQRSKWIPTESYAELSPQADLVRDMFGYLPFRSIDVDRRWLTSIVVDLALAMYQERSFDRMPILADALMDAGCDNVEMIAHCQSEGPHVRGCWVVDLLLANQ